MTETMTAPRFVGDVRLPEGMARYASSAMFDETSAPAALQSEHTTKAGTWALLEVLSGAIDYVVPSRDHVLPVGAGEAAAIEPELVHHIRLNGPVRFRVGFYR